METSARIRARGGCPFWRRPGTERFRGPWRPCGRPGPAFPPALRGPQSGAHVLPAEGGLCAGGGRSVWWGRWSRCSSDAACAPGSTRRSREPAASASRSARNPSCALRRCPSRGAGAANGSVCEQPAPVPSGGVELTSLIFSAERSPDTLPSPSFPWARGAESVMEASPRGCSGCAALASLCLKRRVCVVLYPNGGSRPGGEPSQWRGVSLRPERTGAQGLAAPLPSPTLPHPSPPFLTAPLPPPPPHTPVWLHTGCWDAGWTLPAPSSQGAAPRDSRQGRCLAAEGPGLHVGPALRL